MVVRQKSPAPQIHQANQINREAPMCQVIQTNPAIQTILAILIGAFQRSHQEILESHLRHVLPIARVLTIAERILVGSTSTVMTRLENVSNHLTVIILAGQMQIVVISCAEDGRSVQSIGRIVLLELARRYCLLSAPLLVGTRRIV